jgi:hypothetical protein
MVKRLRRYSVGIDVAGKSHDANAKGCERQRQRMAVLSSFRSAPARGAVARRAATENSLARVRADPSDPGEAFAETSSRALQRPKPRACIRMRSGAGLFKKKPRSRHEAGLQSREEDE